MSTSAGWPRDPSMAKLTIDHSEDLTTLTVTIRADGPLTTVDILDALEMAQDHVWEESGEGDSDATSAH